MSALARARTHTNTHTHTHTHTERNTHTYTHTHTHTNTHTNTQTNKQTHTHTHTHTHALFRALSLSLWSNLSQSQLLSNIFVDNIHGFRVEYDDRHVSLTICASLIHFVLDNKHSYKITWVQITLNTSSLSC